MSVEDQVKEEIKERRKQIMTETARQFREYLMFEKEHLPGFIKSGPEYVRHLLTVSVGIFIGYLIF